MPDTARLRRPHRARVRAMLATAAMLHLAAPQAQSMVGMDMTAMDMSAMHHARPASQPCSSTQWLGCANTATPFMSGDGRLLLTWIEAGAVEFAQSNDRGASWSPALKLGDVGQGFDGGGDARPVLAADAHGHVLVAYDQFKDKDWNAQILLARSRDGGESFSSLQVFEPGSISQRLPALAMLPSGQLLMAWQDKRLSKPAQRPGASIAFSWSQDGGKNFEPSRIAEASSCECCRLGASITPQGDAVLAYRTIFQGSVRDHQIQRFTPGKAPAAAHRVAVDDWVTNACPHHGPSVAVSAQGTIHVTWYTQGKARQGLFYARSTDGGEHFSAPLALGNADRMPARPELLAQAGQLWLVWKEFDGKQTQVRMQRSDDDGQSWSAAQTVASATGYSDHPLLVGDGHQAYLSWLSHEHGYQFMPLP